MAYTTIDDPSAYFQTALYTGNGGTISIVNDGNSDVCSSDLRVVEIQMVMAMEILRQHHLVATIL